MAVLSQPEIRKIVTYVEEIHSDAGAVLAKPSRRALAAAVFKNPFAGKDVQDLSPLFDYGEHLGRVLARTAKNAMAITPDQVENYGKGAIVGELGELEHGHALLHPKLGKPFREECGGANVCTAIIPSSAKMGRLGTSLDIPLHYKRAAFVRSHYDSIEMRISDAPRADEIVLGIALSDSGRPRSRIGGLTKEEAKGQDGLR